MFTKENIRDGSTYLSVHLSANDYYCQGETITGKWYGKLAEQFGIADNVIAPDDRVFENLRKNLTPDGTQKLTPLHPDIRFFDFQCAPHKSVSVMAVTMGDHRLREAHLRAYEVALVELERFAAARSRTGSANLMDENRITGNFCAAVFQHDASRALDPLLHTHTVIANATYDSVRGKRLALTEREMCKAARYAGKVYQNELARNVLQLGYEIRLIIKDGQIEGFKVAGVANEVCERFSKRKKEIDERIEAYKSKHGHEPSKAEIHAIACATRTPKLIEISTPEVRRKQREQLSSDEVAKLTEVRQQALERGPMTIPRRPSTVTGNQFDGRRESGVGLRHFVSVGLTSPGELEVLITSRRVRISGQNLGFLFQAFLTQSVKAVWKLWLPIQVAMKRSFIGLKYSR